MGRGAEEMGRTNQSMLASKKALASQVSGWIEDDLKSWGGTLDKTAVSDRAVVILNRAFRDQGTRLELAADFQGLRIRYAEPTAVKAEREKQWDKSVAVLPLIRLEGGQKWTIPSVSKYKVLINEKPEYSQKVLPPNGTLAAVPMQIPAQHGMLQAMAEYRNKPWTAPSPKEEMATQRSLKPRDVSATGEPAAIQFARVSKGQPGALELTRLVYASEYYVAVARVGPAGNLPHEIADPGEPSKLRSDTIPLDLPSQSGPVVFERTFPVGQLRFSGVKVTKGTPIRQKMNLLAASADHHVDFGNEPDKASKPTVSSVLLFTSIKEQDSFVVRAHEYSFGLRPPSVPLEVWEASQPTIAPLTDARKFAVHTSKRMALNGEKPDSQYTKDHIDAKQRMREDHEADPKKDVTIDDPDVIGYQFEIGNAGVVGRYTLAQEVHNPQLPPEQMSRYPAVTVQVKLKESGLHTVTPRYANKDNGVTVEINEHALDAKSVIPLKITPVLKQGAKLGTPAPNIFLIEVARPFTFMPADLHKCFQVGPWQQDAFDVPTGLDENEIRRAPITVVGQSLPMQLDLTASTPFKDQSQLVESAQIRVQKYSWDGRPLEYPTDGQGSGEAWQDGFRFPTSSEVPNGIPSQGYEDELTRLDGMYFGSRAAENSLLKPVSIHKPSQGKLWTLDPYRLDGKRTGAEYYRFAVSVTNRYAPILRAGRTVDSLDAISADYKEGWKRALVPCRLKGRRNPPAVKLIIPLTAAGEGNEVADLLVVLEEEVNSAGLAALTRTRLAEVAVPPKGPDGLAATPPKILFEGGADATRTPPNQAPQLVKIDGTEAKTLRLKGPIGYTFDTGASNAKYARSAYLVRVEKLVRDALPNGHKDDDLTWWFVKLCFQHGVDPLGVPQRNAAAGAGPEPTAWDSEWTPPVWTQILPACNRWLVSFVDDKGKQENRTEDVKNLRWLEKPWLEDQRGQAVNPNQKALSNGLEFDTWLLVMESASDLLGRPGQELHFALFRLADIEKSIEETPFPPNAIVRLVGVERRTPAKPSELEGLSKELFPDRGRDACARIVQVSPPIAKKS